MNDPTPPRRNRTLAWIVIATWALVLLIAIGLGLSLLPAIESAQTSVAQITVPALPTEREPTASASAIPVTQTPAPTRVLADADSLFEASSTPAPTDSVTPVVFASPTPLPFMAPPLEIGQSANGLPIEVWRFGTGPVKRLIVANIHGGNEYNTFKLAEALITYIQQNPNVIPSTVTLYIIPTLNPDGLARGVGLDGRANENDVDLNRNFPSNWSPEWGRTGCWNYRPLTAGTGPGSEPETQALIDFVLDERPTAIISYHSAALGIFPAETPYGTLHESSVALAEALAEVAPYPYPPIDTGCIYTGTLPDWAASRGIAAVDVELTNGRDTDIDINLAVLDVFLNWRR